MAVSLVSTGVEFPDSTIQTSAAGQPSMSANGSTMINISASSSLWAYGSNAGTILGTQNINTTPFSTIWKNPEVEANMWSSPGASASFYSKSGNGWNATGNYSEAYPRIQYDHYTNRYVATLDGQSGSTNRMNWWSSDGAITWYPFENSNSGTQQGIFKVPAFNNYTGAKVTTGFDYSDTQVRTFLAADAYNESSSNNNTESFGGNAGPVSFIDTGTQSTSKFFLVMNNPGASSMAIISRTADQDANSAAWSTYSLGNQNASSRIIGMENELMCWSYNKGIFRSFNMGASWTNYNFGSNQIGTNGGYYYRHMAWNGSYWLGTIQNDTNTLVSKGMGDGSGNSWTQLTNLSTPGVTNWTGVAWNPTLGCWIIIKNGVMYTNTSSNPNSGTWTKGPQISRFGVNTSSLIYTPIYVKAAKTYNY